MKKYTLILIILSISYAFIAFGKDLVITLSNNDVISIPLEANSSLEVISTPGATLGDVTVQTSDTGMELCDRINAVDPSVTCTGGGGSGAAPLITSFTASPTSITSGGSVTLSWTLANSATSCTKSVTSGSTGSWAGTLTGSQVTNGTHTQTITNITSNSTYRLQCTNSSGTSLLNTAAVTIATTASCVSQPPPPSPVIGEDLTIVSAIGSPLIYNGMFSNIYSGGSSSFPWPGIGGGSLRLSLERNRYIAAQFTTGSANTTGQINNFLVTNFEGPAALGLTWAISECPGDFIQHLGQAKCSSFGTLRWSLEGTGGTARCQLQPNKTYYLNMIHVKPTKIDAGDWTSDCSTSSCGQLSTNTF